MHTSADDVPELTGGDGAAGRTQRWTCSGDTRAQRQIPGLFYSVVLFTVLCFFSQMIYLVMTYLV